MGRRIQGELGVEKNNQNVLYWTKKYEIKILKWLPNVGKGGQIGVPVKIILPTI